VSAFLRSVGAPINENDKREKSEHRSVPRDGPYHCPPAPAGDELVASGSLWAARVKI
jgi:hypothetical protein